MPIPAPDWITFDASKTQGLDLLGLRAPVQEIGNGLLNGLTSVTPKLRYLSVLCWIVWRYAQARLPDDDDAFTKFAAAQEAVIVMANVLRDPSVLRLVGVGKADDLLNSGRRVLPLEPLVRNIAFNIYAAASRQLGLTFESNSGLHGLFEQRGLRLALAFDEVVGTTTYGRRLAKQRSLDRIPRSDIEELSKKISLDILPRGEKALLIEAIMPEKPINPAETKRLATFALLLWLSAQRGADVDEYDLFAAAREPPRNIPDVLGETLDGWLDYTIRDVLAVAHEAAFHAVMDEVDAASASRGAPALAADVIAALLERVDDHNEVLRQSALLAANESVRKLAFQQIAERVQRTCRDGETVSNGLRRWRGGLSETDLYDTALEAGAGAAALLPVAWCLAAHRVTPALGQAPFAPRRVLELGEIYQIGLRAVVLPKVEEFLRLKRTYLEVMAELLVRTVQQHLRVAWSRFATPTGKDVSVLTADVETWARNNRFAAGRTESRLGVAIGWLQQLALIDETGVTSSGRRVLDRALATLEHN
jgi:hypothetical protein